MAKESAAITVSVMWAIWTNRNKYTHKEVQYQPRKSMELIKELIHSLDMPQTPTPKVVVRHRWQAPVVGWVKANIDGAVDRSNACSGVGIVMRDHNGLFQRAKCIRYPVPYDPYTIELTACRDAMVLAREHNVQQLILETDCQMVSLAWKQNDDRSVGSTIIREMFTYLPNFQGFELWWTGREANVAAHKCARVALSIDNMSISFSIIPDFLIDVVQSDMIIPNE